MSPDDDEELRKSIKIIKERTEIKIAELKASLQQWIEDNDGEMDYENNTAGRFDVPVSVTLLETALDRYIALHDTADARDLVLKSFNKRAAKLGRAVQ